ncbi:MAG: response regulator [Cytophagales bacterium]|jgi:CheY-like chemotaxis protein|nr:response regulator [Cytophagales bacterium]
MKSAGACVWMVDDDPLYTTIMQAILQKTGRVAKTIAFNNASDALEALWSQANCPESLPDILLVDINMPVIDGWGFLELYAADKHKLGKLPHVYVVSSSVDVNDIRKAKSFPEVADYLTKPVTVEMMHKLLSQAEEPRPSNGSN